jgi:hypothetical protein
MAGRHATTIFLLVSAIIMFETNEVAAASRPLVRANMPKAVAVQVQYPGL